MGYCGAGLEQRLVKIHTREFWVVADPIRDVTVLDRELVRSEEARDVGSGNEHSQDERTLVKDGDTLVYVLSLFGQVLKCIQLHGKHQTSEAYIDMDVGADGRVLVSNSCGQVAFFGARLRGSSAGHRSQFFAVEAPGIRQYKNSEQLKILCQLTTFDINF